jgi:hypothetical protein
MASEIDICNLALGHLGDNATVASIDPPEGSAQAEHCARFYPIARDTLLESHTWKFATRRATLAQLTVESFNWGFAYAEPNNALRIVSILPADAVMTDEGEQFETIGDDSGNALILTNLEDATAIYTTVVTDTTRYSPLFVDALARLLASYLAGPVLKGDVGKAEAKAQFQAFRIALSLAVVSDSNQRKVVPEHSVAWITGR